MYSGPKTLPAIAAHRAQTEPDRPLIRFEDDVLTGAQLHENALKVAQALRTRGLQPGDKAALVKQRLSMSVVELHRQLIGPVTPDSRRYILFDCTIETESGDSGIMPIIKFNFAPKAQDRYRFYY